MSAAQNAAPNAVPRTVVDYAPDWHGGALFAGLSGAIANTLNSGRPITATSPTFSGWAASPQKFVGAVAALGRARAISVRNSTLSQEKTDNDVTATSIFRDRMRRGQG